MRRLSSLSPEQLRHLAFNRMSGPVFRYFWSVDPGERQRFHDRYTLHQAIRGALEQLRALPANSAERAPLEAFTDEILAEFDIWCASVGRYIEEYFEASVGWATYLKDRTEPSGVLAVTRTALGHGASRFPGHRLSLALLQGEALWQLGELDRAAEFLIDLSRRPYLLPPPDAVPRIDALLSKVCLNSGRLEEHKRLCWDALQPVLQYDGERLTAVKRLARTYGGFLHPLRATEAGWSGQAAYAAWLAHLGLSRIPLYRSLGMNRAGRAATTAVTRVVRRIDRSSSAAHGILVTRAMGGLGDLLMMTPGLHALRRKYPNEPISFAIPKAFHSAFEADPAFELRDIEADDLDLASFVRWHNLTDCPAARVESRSAPNVRKNRIELFAHGMGITSRELNHSGRRPQYVFRPGEQDEARRQLARFRTRRRCVGVQLFSAETYRDYPHTEDLVERLAERHDVIVFHGEPVDGFERPGVFKCDGQPLRTSLALLSQCDTLVGPDSSLIHFAGAFELPSLIISGPISGKVRSADYPNCEYVDASDVLGCVPCWRNELDMCRTGQTRTSICMGLVPVERVVARTEALLHRWDARPARG